MRIEINDYLEHLEKVPDYRNQLESLIRKAFHYGFMQALTDNDQDYADYAQALETLIFVMYNLDKKR